MAGGGRRNRQRRRRAKAEEDAPVPVPVPVEPAEDSSAKTPSSSSSGGGSPDRIAQRKTPQSRLHPQPEDGDDGVWLKSDISAMRRNLLNLIHRYYLEAISRLPRAELRATLARGILVGGHCFGTLRAPHNIIVNAIWYAAAFPLHAAAATEDDDDVRAVLATDGLNRICHRSLQGLVAALRHYCPTISAGDALYHLMDANADLGSAIALANGTSKSSALRVMVPQNLAAFELAAEAARHPNPTAFAHFASALPTVNAKHSLLQYLLINYVLSPANMDHLTTVLLPELPDEPPMPPLTIRPQVLDWISSQRQRFKGTGKQLLEIVDMASQHYTLQTGEELVLHSVCGASLVSEEGLSNWFYHINFLASRKYSGSALGIPVVLFTEATVLAHDEIGINLCVVVDPAKEIGSCFACEANKKRIVHPTYDDYHCCRDFVEDEVDSSSNFPELLDVDYIFFDAERDRDVVDDLDGRIAERDRDVVDDLDGRIGDDGICSPNV